MAARCSLCGSEDGIRSSCPKLEGQVVCRYCCRTRKGLDGPVCLWWELCSSTDLRQWEW